MDMRFEEIDFGFECTPLEYNPVEIEFDQFNIDDQLNILLGIKTQDQIHSEYFTREDVQLMKHNSEDSQSAKTHEKTNFPLEESQTISIETNSNSDKKGVNSHHNFQKHTVTAIREVITNTVLQKFAESSQNFTCLSAMWEDFLAIKGKKIMTKKFLYTLFSSEKSSLKNLKEYGFENLFRKFDENEILCAQKELRSIVYNTFTEKNIRAHVESRNLTRKEDFIQYLLEYREHQLGTGAVKKRMSKISSEKITRHLA